MTITFPYTQSYKKIPAFFKAIQNAAVPTKITQKVLGETFDLKGTNDRTLIGLLKGLGFIDVNGVPTQKYSDYKNPSNAKNILGESIKFCYDALYKKNENLHTLSDAEIKGIFVSITGKESNNKALGDMIGTFLQVKSIAKFDNVMHTVGELSISKNETSSLSDRKHKDFVLTHTIVLNLPVSTEQKVYDVLFKSIKENLL